MTRLEEIEVTRHACTTSITEKVREALTQHLRASTADIAQHLHTSERTLRRRLRTEGASISKIREDILKQKLVNLLHQPSNSLSEIAQTLGFSEQSALTRACKRWYNCSPSKLRNDGNKL